MLGIAGLLPGYFSLVMATGAVSIASQLVGWHTVAKILLPINIVAFVVLLPIVILLPAAPPGAVCSTHHNRVLSIER